MFRSVVALPGVPGDHWSSHYLVSSEPLEFSGPDRDLNVHFGENSTCTASLSTRRIQGEFPRVQKPLVQCTRHESMPRDPVGELLTEASH